MTARGDVREAETELNADRLLPQHIVTFLHALIHLRCPLGGGAEPFPAGTPLPRATSQLTNQTTGFVETNNANGAATQTLMQLKQSIKLPMKPSPSQRRSAEDNIRRTVLVRQQVSHPPGREDGQNEGHRRQNQSSAVPLDRCQPTHFYRGLLILSKRQLTPCRTQSDR